jgi:hypothetical protein
MKLWGWGARLKNTLIIYLKNTERANTLSTLKVILNTFYDKMIDFMD